MSRLPRYRGGEGKGPLASGFYPSPRELACDGIVAGIADGQQRRIIKNGSPGTAMPTFDYFDDEEIWRLGVDLRSPSEHDLAPGLIPVSTFPSRRPARARP